MEMPVSTFKSSLGYWRKKIFLRLFGFLSLVCIPVYFSSVYIFYLSNDWIMIGFDTVCYFVLLIILMPRSLLSDKQKFSTGCALAYTIGVAMLYAVGPTGAGFLWLFMFPPLVAIFLGFQASIVAQLLNLFSLCLLGVAYQNQLLPWPPLPEFNTLIWVVVAINFMVLNAMLTLTLSYLINKLGHSLVSIQASRQATVIGLAKLAEYRDNETGEHLLRMRQYSRMLAKALAEHPTTSAEATSDFIQDISLSAILHDIGKVGISDAILLKPGKLTPDEYERMQAHPNIGAEVLSSLQIYAPQCTLLKMGQEIASCHHEKWDGSGYPNGLKAEAIPLSARIVALADVYDALTSPRCYKQPFDHQTAKGFILEGKGKHFDPLLVDLFINLESEFEKLSLASLANNKDEQPLPSPDFVVKLA